MATVNNGHLTDHFANGTGGSIAYSTASWKGIHFGVKGIFTYNTFSSQLAGNDSINILPAKWEQELFDITSPTKTNDLDRLEELYAAYDHKYFHAKMGKIDIDEGPLLKRRDGRMKPFVYKGLWTNWKPNKKIHVSNGFIWGVSPRGMTEWYDLNEAIGILNNGKVDDSTSVHYHEKTESKGMLVNGVQTQIGQNIYLQFWNYYLHHVQNTSWLQTEWKKDKFGFGAQYVLQLPDNYQKMLDINQRYMDKTSHTISGMAYFKMNEHLLIKGAQLFALGEGRFVFPKEINRDNFYTSQQRSWMDGLGQSSVSLLTLSYVPSLKMKDEFQLDLGVQHVNTCEISDFYHNKYTTPDYTQVNFSAKYYFKNALEGLHLNLLYVCRLTPELPNEMSFDQQYYKTNLHHFNLIIDVVF